MRNAFLVSDEDLRSLRSGEPWSIELTGQAVFLHESVLKVLMQSQMQTAVQQPRTQLIPNVNGPLDNQGRPLLCDQTDCPRSNLPFKTYQARQQHRSFQHHLDGEYARRPHVIAARKNAVALPLPSGMKPETAALIHKLHVKSYDFVEADAAGICGIGDCNYKTKVIRSLHFHRSVKHDVRGINWQRNYHKAKRKVGRPKGATNKKRKVA